MPYLCCALLAAALTWTVPAWAGTQPASIGLDDTAKTFLESWGDNPPKRPLKTWKELVSYRPSTIIQAEVIERGADWAVHRINDGAVGPVNLDYYSIRVRTLPNFPGTKKPMQPRDLLLQMRRLLDARESGQDSSSFRRFAVSFEPFDHTKDKGRWATLTKGAVLRLHFFVPGQVVEWREDALCNKLAFIKLESLCARVQDQFHHSIGVDEGCVVLSEVNESNFRVSTIRAGSGRSSGISWSNAGAHPVSGNREFGYSKRSDSSDYVFYVIGADRLTGALKYEGDVPIYRKFGFAVAEVHWRLYIADLSRFVLDNGGKIDGGAIMDRGVVGWETLVGGEIWTDKDQPQWVRIPPK